MQCYQLARILEGLANGKGFVVFRASRRASLHGTGNSQHRHCADQHTRVLLVPQLMIKLDPSVFPGGSNVIYIVTLKKF
jgi:hypothetical protein